MAQAECAQGPQAGNGRAATAGKSRRKPFTAPIRHGWQTGEKVHAPEPKNWPVAARRYAVATADCRVIPARRRAGLPASQVVEKGGIVANRCKKGKSSAFLSAKRLNFLHFAGFHQWAREAGNGCFVSRL